jgi:hypothetical protein
MKDQEIIDNAPDWADTHRKLLDYPDCTTYVDNKYEDKLDRSLADIKRILELENIMFDLLSLSSFAMSFPFEYEKLEALKESKP